MVLGQGAPTLVTTLEDSRTVLSQPENFVLPFDVSRRRLSPHGAASKPSAPLSRAAVETGQQVLGTELAAAAAWFDGPDVDTLSFLRAPLGRSTAAALLPVTEAASRNTVADLVLAWVDSLAPVISAPSPPRAWTRTRRTEQRARRALAAELSALGCPNPQSLASTLAAGIQVPIAAGAWCLTQLACRPALQASLRGNPRMAEPVVWEVLRLYPPSWMLPRIATRDVALATTTLSAYTVVLVSPVALGRLESLAPGVDAGCSPLTEFDPERWVGAVTRPGAWLPFGAGTHACPGRSLGLAQLTDLVRWASNFDLSSAAPPGVDASRGLAPAPDRIGVRNNRSGPA